MKTDHVPRNCSLIESLSFNRGINLVSPSSSSTIQISHKGNLTNKILLIFSGTRSD